MSQSRESVMLGQRQGLNNVRFHLSYLTDKFHLRVKSVWGRWCFQKLAQMFSFMTDERRKIWIFCARALLLRLEGTYFPDVASYLRRGKAVTQLKKWCSILSQVTEQELMIRMTKNSTNKIKFEHTIRLRYTTVSFDWEDFFFLASDKTSYVVVCHRRHVWKWCSTDWHEFIRNYIKFVCISLVKPRLNMYHVNRGVNLWVQNRLRFKSSR